MTQHRVPNTSRRKELQEKIEDIEKTLRNLREQLRAEEESNQHDAIDHLDEYLGEIDNKYTNLREFWNVIRDELRDLVSKGASNEHKK